MIQTYTAQLVEKKNFTHEVIYFKLALIDPPQIEFIAGQYILLQVPEHKKEGQKELTVVGRRNYSICSPSWVKEYIELIIHIVPEGLASNYLLNLEEGEHVSFQGPAGVFTLKNTLKPKIFLATGTGIAPIRSQLLSFLANTSHAEKSSNFTPIALPDESEVSLYLLWGLKTRGDMYFFDELKKLATDNPCFSFSICLSRESSFERLDPIYMKMGRVNQHLLDYVDACARETNRLKAEIINTFEYYLCGGREVIPSFITFLEGIGVLRENIFCERF
ncbi:MAG TPA: FAD-dependent oxidoreductase [Patescibacteria group bacterium]|nr:FAD-dependent oxidoreductase [Patescibacteria group bacterium]